VGESVLFLTAGGNPFTSFENIEFDPVNPGAGSSDFQLLKDGDTYYLRLLNALNKSVRSDYELNFDVVTRNVLDTSLVSRIPLVVRFKVQDLRQLSPALDVTFPAATYTSPLTVGDLLSPVGNVIDGAACPLSPADNVLGELAGGLDQLIGELPVIPQDTLLSVAKRLMEKLPAYFWIAKDGSKTRINLKIPVKGKTLRIEYVIDPNGGCYWGALLDKLKPSSVHSSLAALDANTQAGIVVNTVPVTDKDFKCITIPCLALDPGAHVVATGEPIPYSAGGNGAQALLSPKVFAVVSPLSSGYSDPELTVRYGLKANFKTVFSDEMVQRLDLASSATRTSIKLAEQAIKEAEEQLENALRKLHLDQLNLNRLDARIASFTRPVNNLTNRIAGLNSQALAVAADIASTLLEDQICTPGVCLIPCLTPGWCSRSCGFFSCSYPCLRSCGCEVRAPQICVPNPVAELAAATLGRNKLRPLQNHLAHATAALDRAQQRLANVSSPREALLAAFQTATDASTQANNNLLGANNALSSIMANSGPLGDVADFILKNTINKTVATSKATFITTLASANNGTYSGQLIVDMSILASPTVTVTFPAFKLTGNDIESSLQGAVNIILDQID
ncbi:MAG: hypothetical protein AAFO94_00290, partial [Bacteroidota bacterium]